MSETSPSDSHEGNQDFEAAVAAIEAAEPFRRYCERLHHFVSTGDHGDGLDVLRQEIATLARAERWTPSVILKAIRRGCYLDKAGPDEAGRHAVEVDRLLYAFFHEHS